MKTETTMTAQQQYHAERVAELQAFLLMQRLARSA
jgi:hypothetical protein